MRKQSGIAEALSLLDEYLISDRVWENTDHIVSEILCGISTPLTMDELIKLTNEANTQLSAKKITVKNFL
jgi:hypothetical protein